MAYAGVRKSLRDIDDRNGQASNDITRKPSNVFVRVRAEARERKQFTVRTIVGQPSGNWKEGVDPVLGHGA